MRLWVDLVKFWLHQQNLPRNILPRVILKSEACTECYMSIPVAIFQPIFAEEKIISVKVKCEDGTKFLWMELIPSKHLLIQSRQWKHQGNVLNLFKVNKKNKTSMTSFWCLYYWRYCWLSCWLMSLLLILNK